jgi:cellulose synthase/poly-beta-1,6-N-acetylglucosamine synthase-like glycosyltransferase
LSALATTDVTTSSGSTASSISTESSGSTESSADELVTVFIPARDEEHTIAGVLDSVLGQTHQHLQVLVIDGVSTDRTAAIVAEYAARDDRVELIVNPDRVIPFALNLAADHARSQWLVRVDAHSRVPADYVERVLQHLRSGRWGGVGGRKNGVGHTATGRAIAAVMGSKFAQGNSVYHYGTEVQTVDHVPFGAYPVEVVRELGGWSETQLVNEDFEFDYRVRLSGRELLFDPSIEIEWDCRQRIGDLFRQYRRYGAGKVQTLRAHPESAALRHLAAPTMIAGLGAAAALAPWRRTRPLAAVIAAPYAAVLVAGTASVVPQLVTPQERRAVVPAFLALHLGWGIGFWQEAWSWLRSRGRGARSRPGMAASAGSVR